ncbi:hypothetical protein B0T14DRAFT_195683 [Immersiella caudata]|uniref:Uncharacterized protein n=1 Tax=Immersiella caudata TaxID=314043 RepID=A0AA40C444_9PEZI|nr:hypothetical protein B0T14DRAFT_195683 [Immersiella caudata]
MPKLPRPPEISALCKTKCEICRTEVPRSKLDGRRMTAFSLLRTAKGSASLTPTTELAVEMVRTKRWKYEAGLQRWKNARPGEAPPPSPAMVSLPRLVTPMLGRCKAPVAGRERQQMPSITMRYGAPAFQSKVPCVGEDHVHSLTGVSQPASVGEKRRSETLDHDSDIARPQKRMQTEATTSLSNLPAGRRAQTGSPAIPDRWVDFDDIPLSEPQPHNRFH